MNTYKARQHYTNFLLCVSLALIFIAVMPALSEAKADYEIKNNIVFENKGGESTVGLVQPVKMQIPFKYRWQGELYPFDDYDSVTLINNDDNEIGRIVVAPAGKLLANKREVELDYDVTLRVFINYMTVDPLLNPYNSKWLYFGYTRVSGYPVIYGVANYYTSHIEGTIYDSSVPMKFKLLYFFGKQQLYKITVVFPENESEHLETVFDSIIGSIKLPEDHQSR